MSLNPQQFNVVGRGGMWFSDAGLAQQGRGRALDNQGNDLGVILQAYSKGPNTYGYSAYRGSRGYKSGEVRTPHRARIAAEAAARRMVEGRSLSSGRHFEHGPHEAEIGRGEARPFDRFLQKYEEEF